MSGAMILRLEVIPENLRSLGYELREGGTPVGRIEHTPLHALEKGTIKVSEEAYSVVREGLARASYQLRREDGRVRVRAERHGASAAAYRLIFDATELLLRKQVLARRETYLIGNAAGEAGRIVREKLGSRRMTVELGESASHIPREIVFFLVWLAILIHRKDGAEVGGSGA
ncbi:MAG: hypothetical protein JW820_11415 [Spirochaetales bacterium]|nr:hypothetical protein [Spirochaetales bacterium]